jgi:hypothetical protein
LQVESKKANMTHEMAASKNAYPSFSQVWAYRIDTTKAGRLWDYFDVSLSFIFCIVYIANSLYIGSSKEHTIDEPLLLYYADIVIAFCILLQWLPRVVFTTSVVKRLFSAFCLSTLVSCVPVLLAAFQRRSSEDGDEHSFYANAGNFVYLYPLRFLRLHVSLARCLVPAQQGLLNFSLITRKVRTAHTLLFMWLIPLCMF